jgi:hypothetical protein
MSYLGAIEDIGASPYKISGDPVTALVAQVNRFSKGQSMGGTCPPMKAFTPLPLVAGLSQQGATIAWALAGRRFDCAPSELRSAAKVDWVTKGSDNPWVWAMNNLNELTITLAQYGDSLGLAPASVGITQRDPKMTPKFPMVTAVLLGALAIGAVVISRRAR